MIYMFRTCSKSHMVRSIDVPGFLIKLIFRKRHSVFSIQVCSLPTKIARLSFRESALDGTESFLFKDTLL